MLLLTALYLQVWKLDVSDLQSVREFSQKWLKTKRELNCLVTNAGIFGMRGVAIWTKQLWSQYWYSLPALLFGLVKSLSNCTSPSTTDHPSLANKSHCIETKISGFMNSYVHQRVILPVSWTQFDITFITLVSIFLIILESLDSLCLSNVDILSAKRPDMQWRAWKSRKNNQDSEYSMLSQIPDVLGLYIDWICRTPEWGAKRIWVAYCNQPSWTLSSHAASHAGSSKVSEFL